MAATATPVATPATLRSSPFPGFVAYVLVDDDSAGDDEPHADELELLSPQAVPKRRVDFARGRIAARRALEALGIEPRPVLSGERREPLWPDAVVGALSHTDGRAIAAVTSSGHSAGLGVDLEVVPERELRIGRTIAHGAELDWLHQANTGLANQRVIQLLSAKESVFKAFYRHRREYFGFRAVSLRWDEGLPGFRAVLEQAMGPRFAAGFRFDVGCTTAGGFVLTHVTLPA